MWRNYNVILENIGNTTCVLDNAKAISDNWNHLMGLRDMKYIGLKHQRENKQNSDNNNYQSEFEICNKLK